MTDPRRHCTVAFAARQLGVGSEAVHKMCQAKRLDAFKRGREWRVSMSDLQRLKAVRALEDMERKARALARDLAEMRKRLGGGDDRRGVTLEYQGQVEPGPVDERVEVDE